MHINKESYLMIYFIQEFRIAPTVMKLNSVELVYDI
jgi:hypothetical protein